MPRFPVNEIDVQEGVHAISDAETGLVGAIVVHSTALGPAAGGCRLWNYSSHADMVTDGLRLARGMSYKNAMAGLPLGGGKAVLQAPLSADRRAVFKAFGRAVNALGGRYVTAEDVGTTVADMECVREETRHVAGLPATAGRAGGDPSPWTALGVFEAMKVASQHRYAAELSDLTIAVQGLGSVGGELCRLLSEAGAKLIVSDVDFDKTRRLALRYGAVACAPEEIHAVDADVLSPCALGAGLNETTIPALKAHVICGAANNQLATATDGYRLEERDILYAPDYVVNAGGIINVAAEYLGETAAEVEARVRNIPLTLQAVFDRAGNEGLPTDVVADRMASELVSSAAQRSAA